jgi:hypothetical protein
MKLGQTTPVPSPSPQGPPGPRRARLPVILSSISGAGYRPLRTQVSATAWRFIPHSATESPCTMACLLSSLDITARQRRRLP